MAAVPADLAADAEEAGLVYVTDDAPGITRRRRGKGWSYRRPDGSLVSGAERERIESLAIPPAWQDVWICPSPAGHVQATGRDDRGRKVYRYHPRWREMRDANKYDRLAEFGATLPKLRERVERDLSSEGLPEEKVLAAVVRLLDETLIRIGNDEYARGNESFGLTTLREDHVSVEGQRVRFEFSAKSGVEQDVALRDRRLAAIVRACQELPGEELFGYVDTEGRAVDVTSTMVNEYLRSLCGASVTAKDFRTWGGTVTAAEVLAELPVPESEREAKSNELAAVDTAADRLGNTRAVCRSCYVHPRIPEAYREGDLQEAWRRAREQARLTRIEGAVLRVLDG